MGDSEDAPIAVRESIQKDCGILVDDGNDLLMLCSRLNTWIVVAGLKLTDAIKS